MDVFTLPMQYVDLFSPVDTGEPSVPFIRPVDLCVSETYSLSYIWKHTCRSISSFLIAFIFRRDLSQASDISLGLKYCTVAIMRSSIHRAVVNAWRLYKVLILKCPVYIIIVLENDLDIYPSRLYKTVLKPGALLRRYGITLQVYVGAIHCKKNTL